jgi:hypothetical protein
MRSLHPVAARADVQHDLTAAAEASERNRAPGGGWTDVHAIKPPKTNFTDVELRARQVEVALEPLMPRVRRFYATASGAIGKEKDHDLYGSYDDNAVCFGFDSDCYLRVDTAGELVGAIWFERRSTDKAQIGALRRALEAIDRLTPCMLVDYWLDAEGAVGDATFLDRYFAG